MATTAPDLGHRLRDVHRTREGAVLGGVCAGLARTLGVDPLVVRIGAVAIAVAAGVGVPAYLIAWAFLPLEQEGQRVPSHREATAKEVAGVALLVLAALGGLRELGIWWSDAVVWPVVLTTAGLALIWRQSRGRPSAASDVPVVPTGAPPGVATIGPLGELPRFGPRLIGGALLVVAGGVFLLGSIEGIGTLGELAAAVAVVLAGVTLIFGTSWVGLLRTLNEERSERVRSQERAELAAHLHDSVLQTLALIQRRGDEEVAQLARRQERELRAWLNSAHPLRRPGEGATHLLAALEAMAADVEDHHGVTVEVVAVGDAPLTPRLEALVAAAREATVNAAKFAGTGHVDVFAEATDQRVEVFVRDRGPGFDRTAVDPARRGIRESIEGRMRRHGGAAHVRTAPGEGTEVELAVTR